MTIKTICLSISLLCLGTLLGQSDSKETLDAYRKAKKEALPLEQEGTRARNKEVLDSIASDFGASQEGSFDYHIVTYMNSSQKLRDAYHLQQAMALSPDDPDLIGEAIEYYGMIGDEASIKKMTGKLKKYGLYHKYERYYLDFNSLMKEYDILFTNGESDTRPLLMNRSAAGKDYEIIRIAWLTDPLYLVDLRSRGIICPEVYTTPSDFIRQVITQNPYRRVLLSPTLNPELLSKFDTELIAIGLGLTIGDNLPYDIVDDYLSVRPSLMDGDQLLKSKSGLNYLPLLSAARLSYLQKELIDEAAEIANLIHKILTFNDLEELEEQLLK